MVKWLRLSFPHPGIDLWLVMIQSESEAEGLRRNGLNFEGLRLAHQRPDKSKSLNHTLAHQRQADKLCQQP